MVICTHLDREAREELLDRPLSCPPGAGGGVLGTSWSCDTPACWLLSGGCSTLFSGALSGGCEDRLAGGGNWRPMAARIGRAASPSIPPPPPPCVCVCVSV